MRYSKTGNRRDRPRFGGDFEAVVDAAAEDGEDDFVAIVLFHRGHELAPPLLDIEY